MPSPRERALLKEDDVKIVRMPLSAVTSGPDIGISPHAVDQYFDWTDAEPVKCHVKFFQ